MKAAEKARLNAGTQPRRALPVFGNEDVVARGWYVACASRELPRRSVKALRVGDQHLALFRGVDGVARCVDGFCAHLGMDLARGRVDGDRLRCMFHGWAYAGDGACVDAPCRRGGPPPRARVAGYAVREKYGCIWVHPDAAPPHELVELPTLEGSDVVWSHGRTTTHEAHHHVLMVNGLDLQHLSTVHDVGLAMRAEQTEDPARGIADIVVRGEVGGLLGRAIGGRYAYAMRFADATIGALTMVHEVALFGRRLPELTMLFAFRPIGDGRTEMRRVYVTRARRGIVGWFVARLLLAITRVASGALEDEDAAIFEGIRFQPGLIPEDDALARYVAWVDRLPRSDWSRRVP